MLCAYVRVTRERSEVRRVRRGAMVSEHPLVIRDLYKEMLEVVVSSS